jgi:hypothetical protein
MGERTAEPLSSLQEVVGVPSNAGLGHCLNASEHKEAERQPGSTEPPPRLVEPKDHSSD